MTGLLVTPGSPTEAEQLQAQEQAKLGDPEDVAMREESQTKFESLGNEQAAGVTSEAFPLLVDEPAGGPPHLPAGQSITGYVNGYTAQVDLGEGEHGLVESLAPMAIAASSTSWSRVNLGLSEHGGAFEPMNPLVVVRIPKRLGEGVSAPLSGVSLTPVDANGAPLAGGEGVVDGASVFFANTQADSDTLAKPGAYGFSVDTVLRSVESPHQSFYRVGLPSGASLSEASDGSVDVLSEGSRVGRIPVPRAQDAAGRSVPLSMSLNDDTLVVEITDSSTAYQYPIVVDPEFNLGTTTVNTKPAWEFSSTGGFVPSECCGGLTIEPSGAYAYGQRGEFFFRTNGDSRIYKLNSTVEFAQTVVYGSGELYISGTAEIYAEGESASGREERTTLAAHGVQVKLPYVLGKGFSSELCMQAGCSVETPGEHNLVRLAEVTTGNPSGSSETTSLTSAILAISQPKSTHSTVTYNMSPEIEYTTQGKKIRTPNLAYTNGWVGPKSGGAYEFIASDAGLGVSETFANFNTKGYWEAGSSKSYLLEPACKSIECSSEEHAVVVPSNFTLASGEDKIRVGARDAMEHTSSAEFGEGEHVLKVDSTPPFGISLTGLSTSGSELELGEVEGHVSVEASDGVAGVPSSGIKSIALGINGKEIGRPSGACSAPTGPCAAKAEWAVNGAELGLGTYTLTVVATDRAGNVATKNYTLNVYHASPVAVGPGSVNPESGDFALEADDVNVSGGAGMLAVTRHYDSRNLTEGKTGPLGPQWTISLGELASLEELPDKSVMIVGPEGLTHFNTKTGGGFEAPAGDTNLTLELQGSEYLLRNTAKGTTTRFTRPSGSEAWMPTVSEGPVATDTLTDSYRTVEGVVEPTLELAPHPAASCPAGEPEKWGNGCRGLAFVYAEKTKEHIGEAEGEWGEYKGRLQEVTFIVSTSKGITKTAVAKYEYDKLGRLRAEVNPATSLKTTYGYDEEGHITAIGPSGVEPWLLHYGTIEGDSSTGRLLSVARANASSSGTLKEVEARAAPANTKAPKLSTTTPAQGAQLSAEMGTWSNSPLSYSYQWERCNAKGEECTAILGAVDEKYTVRYGKDEGSTLRVDVTATDAGGSSSATSAASSIVPSSTLLESTPVAFGSAGSGTDQFKAPSYIAYAKQSESWAAAKGAPVLYVTDTGNNRIEVFTTTGEYLGKFGEEGSGKRQFKEPTGIAFGEPNEWEAEIFTESVENVFVADSVGKRFQWLYCGGCAEYGSRETAGTGQLGGVTAGGAFSEKYLVNRGENDVERLNAVEEDFTNNGHFGSAGTENGKFKEPSGIAYNPINRYLYVVDTGNSRIEYFTLNGLYEGKFGIAGLGSGNLNGGYFKEPKGIAIDEKGNVWVVDSGNSRIQELSATGTFMKGFGLAGTSKGQFKTPTGIAVDPSGDVYVVDTGNNRVQAWKPLPLPSEPALPAAQPPTVAGIAVTSIDYNVPVSGAAPHQMGSSEVATWGQSDDPTAATAIFPPDEPMGWPAKDYRRATISYMDIEARTVNVATPTGAISTKEYNQQGQVKRALSADNRQSAVNEGCVSLAKKECKSAETAELLDTKSSYNTKGQLTDTWGPQHTVKLVAGREGKSEEALVRNHVKYHYDEESPKGETYNLVTKTEDSAENTSKEEFDTRTSLTAYSGQSNLGWKLHAPTSTRTDPTGLNLTTTIRYEEPKEGQESTGNVIETRSAAVNGANETVPPAFGAQFGKLGSEPGQLKEPTAATITSTGNVDILDTGNNRIEEFTASGTYNHVTFGSPGTGNGQFKNPRSMIEDAKGDLLVADTGNNRLEELNSKGEYVTQIGKEGTAEGQFKEPTAIAIASGGSIFVADTGNNRVEKFNESGVFQVAFGWGVSNGEAKLESCKSGCKAGLAGSGLGQLYMPRGIAVSAGYVWVADTANNRLERFNEGGENPWNVGSHGTGNHDEFSEPKAITIEPATGDLWVSDTANDRLQKLSSSTDGYLTSIGVKGTGYGQFEEPWGTALTSGGTLYIADAKNARIQRWVPTITGNNQAHETKTIYYTAKNEAEATACQGHPEWAGLPCRTEPVAHPGIAGAPELPVTTVSYNIWDQPETVEETFTEKVGETQRTIKREKKTSYDAIGRPVSSKETTSPATDKALPEVTDKYNSTSGLLEEQATTGEEPKATTTKYNTLDQLESYTDATGNTTMFEYEKEQDARLIKVADTKGSQSFHYDTTTGFLTELIDSGAGTIRAEYDLAGKLANESYQNAMTATFMHNSVGETTSVEYKKTAHCASSCPEAWYSDAVTPSVHGETLRQVSSLSEEPSYTYNAAGWLTQTQEIPAGEGCKTRLYAYDEEGDRISQTTREPGSEGKCANEGGNTEWHTYQTANSMTDTGVTYDPFGDTTKLPAADAGGSELASEYYLDGQVFKQEQNGRKIEYKLDPAGRTRQTITTGTSSSTMISRYGAPGGAVAWTGEGTGETEKWSRDIPGIDGTLVASQVGEGKTGKPAVLLLHDLQGDVVAEAALSETETKLIKKYNSTEFGVPNSKEAPPKYAWLGATGATSELPSGIITQDGITYVPQTGRPLQSQGILLPSPENTATPFTEPVEAWVGSRAGEGAAIGIAKAKELEERQAAANQPPGTIPMPACGPAGEYCAESEGEEESSGSGCTGTHACAAYKSEGVVDYHESGNESESCSVWGSWGSGELLASQITGWGHWECVLSAVYGFEMRIAAYADIEGVTYRLGEDNHPITEVWYNEESGQFKHTFKCPRTGSFYHLWVWGRWWPYGGHTEWSGAGWERRVGKCVDSGTVDMSPVGQAGEPQ